MMTYDIVSDDHCDVTKVISGNLRTHTGEETHKCTECSKSFSQVSHMRTNLQTQADEKLHKSFREVTQIIQ